MSAPHCSVQALPLVCQPAQDGIHQWLPCLPKSALEAMTESVKTFQVLMQASDAKLPLLAEASATLDRPFTAPKRFAQ